MRHKNIYMKFLLPGCFTLGLLLVQSCNDFLTVLPTNELPEDNFFQDETDLDNVRAGAYNQLTQSGQTTKILQWGELRSDNLTLNNQSNTNISYLQSGVLQPSNAMFDWSGFYKGINFCNLVIEHGERMTTPGNEVDPGFTRSDYRSLRAEMLALRSLYYFYLVRAYRDVPYIENAIRSDQQAMTEFPAATPGVALLGLCIDSLEANVQYAIDNFGSTSDNKGRFTKLGVHALLADMYLWRAGLLKNYLDKPNGDDGRVNATDVAVTNESGATTSYTTADGTAVTNAYCNELSNTCLNKAIEHADWVLNKMKEDYDELLDNSFSSFTSEERSQPFPLYRNLDRGGSLNDVPYSYNFGTQNSRESIFELQYDGSTSINSTVNDYLTTYENGEFKAQVMAVSSNLYSGVSQVDPTVGFGKTDLRLFETANYATTNGTIPVAKFVQTDYLVNDIKDLGNNKTDGTGYYMVMGTRTPTSNNAHWPVYRIADVMLIKAEAIARLGTTDKKTLAEGFLCNNELFARNNPALKAENSSEPTLVSSRINNYGTFVSGKWAEDDGNSANQNNPYNSVPTADDLLTLTYRERQREFVCEGKRWFDIVRQAEFSNDPKTTLTNYATVKNSVVSRLANLWAFYIPIYSEELKVNGVGYVENGKLKQNPVWDRYTKK